MLNRILFSFFALPSLFSSMFSVVDVFPYGELNLIYNGTVIEMTSAEKAQVEDELVTLLQSANEMPALSVTFPELYDSMIEDGYFLNFKFDALYSFNGLTFNELTIKVNSDENGFNIYRGTNGVFQGRCFYLSTQKSTSALYDAVSLIVDVHMQTSESVI